MPDPLSRATRELRFTTGQLATATDMTRLQHAVDTRAVDLILSQLLEAGGSKVSTGFLGGGFLVTQSGGGGLGISVAAGLGFYYDSTVTDEFSPVWQPMAQATAYTATLDAHEANPRIDIVCVKPGYTDDTSETVGVKSGGSISTTSLDRRRVVSRTYSIVKGTASGSPAVPSTPSGYVKIAECAVPATSGSVVVTDSRPKLYLSHDCVKPGDIVAADLASNAVTTAKIADDAVTGAKLSVTPVYADMSVAAEVSNEITVTLQMKDIDGNNAAAIYYLELTLATVNGLVTSASDYYFSALTTGTRVAETNDPITANTPYLLIATNGSGVAVFKVKDQATGTSRGVRVFAQPMGAYGPRKYIQCPFN